MKSIKIIFSILTILVAFSVQAQKVKIKKGIAYVDGKEFVQVEKSAGNMSVYSIEEDEEIIFIKHYDPTPSNNQNNDSYYIVRFIDFDVEVEFEYKTRKGILKLLYKDKVVQSGKIDKERLKRFVSKYGSDASKNKLYINN